VPEIVEGVLKESEFPAMIGQMLFEYGAIQIFGTENYAARNTASFMGAIAGGALGGAAVGGPVGLGFGAVWGAASVPIGIGLNALEISGLGVKVFLIFKFLKTY
jgi:hypothetical protein